MKSREFGPNVFERLEQGSQARGTMLRQTRTVENILPIRVVISPVEPASVSKGYPGLVLIASALGIALGLNFVDNPSIASAGKDSTATPTRTPTPTPTQPARARATVVISAGEQGVNVQVNNSVTLDQQLIDTLRGPAAVLPQPSVLPAPTAVPTPKDPLDALIDEQARIALQIARGQATELQIAQIERIQRQINELRYPSATPNATATAQSGETITARAVETRTARAEAGLTEIAGRQATGTASVPRSIARAKAAAEAAAIELEAAQIQADAQADLEEARRLRGATPTPATTPSNGEFPWMPIAIISTGLAALYLLRERIIPAPVVVPGAPAHLTIIQRFRALRGPRI